MSETLHRSAEMEVRRVAAGDGARIVITFDPYHDAKGFDREGFGEAYFAREGITAIHILTRDNDWYQYRDLPAVLETVWRAAAPAARRLAYGSSMGGYAALRFAAAVGAETALALSPQYSVDPRKAPFERRWLQDQRRIRFRRDLDGPIRGKGVRAVVAYDPTLAADRRHVAAIARDRAIDPLPLPYAGHPVGAFLSESGLLRPIIAQALAGEIDVAAVATLAHARRTAAPTWLGELAARQPPWRSGLALRLAERAAGIAPDNPAVLDRLGARLAERGEFARAAAVHRQAIALHPIANYRWGLGRTLLAAGDAAGALAVAEALIAEAPEVAGYRRWAADIRLGLGDADGAWRDLRAAVRLAPRNWGYRRAALALGWRRLGKVP